MNGDLTLSREAHLLAWELVVLLDSKKLSNSVQWEGKYIQIKDHGGDKSLSLNALAENCFEFRIGDGKKKQMSKNELMIALAEWCVEMRMSS